MFRRTYDEIAELIKRSLLDADLARDIIRKSGVLAEAALESTLDWLLELWLTKEVYNTPINVGGTNYDYRKDNPKKASAEDYDIEFMSDHSGWRFASVGTYDIYDHSPTHWGRANEFPPGSYFSGTGHISNFYKTHVFITGSNLYDPFPYPELPCYFYADLKHIETLIHWYDPRFIVRFSGVQAFAPYGRLDPVVPYAEASVPYTDPITLKLWASLDDGATWEDPIYTAPGFPSNANLALALTGTGSSTAAFQRSRRTNSGLIKGEFRRDGVLLKYTLEVAVATDWVYLTAYGVRGYQQGLFDPEEIAS